MSIYRQALDRVGKRGNLMEAYIGTGESEWDGKFYGR